MLFSEIYGSYFNVVAAILAEAASGSLTGGRLTGLIQEKAFAESVLTIPAALKNGDWPLLGEPPVIRHKPEMPLTTLQKRWLKSLLLDPRIALFAPDAAGLEDVKPLCQPDVFVYFDRYADGYPYSDEAYIERFRTVLAAVREKKLLRLSFHGRTGIRRSVVCVPCRLEYSAKDDKFRLLAEDRRRKHIINLARIDACETLGAYDPEEFHLSRKRPRELVLLLHDERNALERVLLHFSHFEKETRKLDSQLYEIRLRYDRDDETELLIRVLSFGPVLEVTSPPDFAAQVRERIDRQLRYPFPSRRET